MLALLDFVAAALASRDRIFAGGWGDRDRLARLAADPEPFALRAQIAPTWGPPRIAGGLEIRDGTFPSPLALLAPEVATARVRWLRAPGRHSSSACVVLAASRDEGPELREAMFGPLARAGIEVLVPENAYYGARRVPGRRSQVVRTVEEHILMNVASVVEARALLEWLGREGRTSLGVVGYSMGGHMAAVTAAVTPAPLAIAALATGASPAPIFTEGLLSWSVDFGRLARDGRPNARARLGVLFDLADLRRHPPPRRPEAAILLANRRDGYVSPREVQALHAHWRGSELRWLGGGHVSAVLAGRGALRRAVLDAFARL